LRDVRAAVSRDVFVTLHWTGVLEAGSVRRWPVLDTRGSGRPVIPRPSGLCSMPRPRRRGARRR
jgi:hypothetical protein